MTALQVASAVPFTAQDFAMPTPPSPPVRLGSAGAPSPEVATRIFVTATNTVREFLNLSTRAGSNSAFPANARWGTFDYGVND